MHRTVPHQAMQQLSRQPITKNLIQQSLREKNAYLKAYRAKRRDKAKEGAAITTHKNSQAQIRQAKNQINLLYSNARKARREDWELGPLAPKRDVGKDAGYRYGSVPLEAIRPPKLEEDLKWRRKQGKLVGYLGSKGTAKDIENYGNEFWPGDRVAVVKGRHKGKIGTVKEVAEGSGYIWVLGTNNVDFVTQEWMRKAEGDDAPFRTHLAPIRISDVRLVQRIEDPETEESKEVILDTMEFRTAYDPEGKGRRMGPNTRLQRSIPVLGTAVQSNRKHKETDDRDIPYHDSDSLLIQTEEETFIPSLASMPMPETVIDELRNKYSRFRDRHDDEWLEKRTERERESQEGMNKRERLMRTPASELRQRTDGVRKVVDQSMELNEDVLRKIGEAMAAKMKPETIAARLETLKL